MSAVVEADGIVGRVYPIDTRLTERKADRRPYGEHGCWQPWRGYGCTLRQGHDGTHQAAGTRSQLIAEWPVEP